MKRLILIYFLSFVISGLIYSQSFMFNGKEIQLEKTYKVRISNGTEIIGRVVGYNENRGITVQFSNYNSYTYTIEQVISIEEVVQSPFYGGVGLGVPYGYLGIQLGISPVEHIEITAGAGSSFFGSFAWNVGLQGHFLPPGEEFRPFISAYYGTNRFLNVFDSYLELYHKKSYLGFSPGAGLAWSVDSKRKHIVVCEALYLINEQFYKDEDDVEEDYGDEYSTIDHFPFQIAVGYRYNF
ncbi:MAG: hypothetical protein JXB49_07580 [Bacteroidales bacterium]|nr:hypothetical protein [Bacteroidales bacterium]